MRILVVTQYFWPENFRINDLVSELVKRGHQVTVLTGKPNYPDGKFFPNFLANPEEFKELNGVKIIRVPILARGVGNLKLALNYLAFALSASFLGPWLLKGQAFDAIFAYEPSPITVGIPAAVMRYFKKAPLIFWVLDLWPETIQALDIVRSKFILWMLKKLVQQIYQRCDLILAQSKSFIPKIAQYTSAYSQIEYFPSWSDITLNDQVIKPASEIPIKSGCFNIMFAGNIGEAQDFPTIVEAAYILKSHLNIRWIIIGSGRQSKKLKEEVQMQGLEHCFLFLGQFSVERMPSFFVHADVLLVSLKKAPIFAMTIPGKLQSYLASGIPILAMLDGEGADIIRNADAGIICSAGDSRELAKSVLRLSRTSIRDRQLMGKRGKALSLREFDRDKLISKLERWFKLPSCG